ncbi:flagellar filament capping protein FliD [Spongiibacter sp. KMU-166]|uniref:Flagellar hook-associated protein 2 n=1 Tax=Spongiibacter thalassae TaxID=2721624 RepID=A0ABX1GCU5_9GAMM|nr:flagellar filament capping protein FliD [Spongiibacter thalassae]NKI16766.1 flagellar filament capping protein FliD [Spongiibacter thalassae]
MASVTAQGIGSGLDISGLVSQLVEAERAPQANRLAGKEARIQARLSAFGSLKSALDTFKNSLSALKNAETFSKRSATVGDKDIFTASVNDTAVAGNYSVSVEQLATRHKIASAAYADSATSVGTGTLQFTVNGESFSIDVEAGSDSLASIRDAVNSAEDNVGVTATIVNDQDGAHLVFSSNNSGVENEMTIAVTTDGGDTGDLTQLAFDPNAVSNPMTEKVEALDSIVDVDGFTQSSPNLVVEDMIEGVTLNLVKAQPGEKIELSVALDTASVKKSIESFVTNYNKLVTTLNDLTAFDPEANTAGLLQGDSTTRGIAQSIRQEIGVIVDGVGSDINSLAQLGITTGDKGKLKIDSDILTDRINNNFGEIGDVFSSESGYAVRFDALISGLTQSGGIIASRTDGLESQIDRIGDQREVLNRRVAAIEARYFAQFTALDSLLGQLTSTGDFLNQQLANLPGIVRNKD